MSPSNLKNVLNLADPGQAVQDNAELLNRNWVQFNTAGISGLTGGGPTKLDGIATVNLDAGFIVRVYNGTTVVNYRLRAGTDAESSPNIIRPDDYASSTNEKVWELMSITAAGVNHLFSTTNRQTQTDPSVGVDVTLIDSYAGSLIIPANTLKPGSILKINCQGRVDATGDASSTVVLKVKLDGTEIVSSQPWTAANLFTNNFAFMAHMIVRSIGATGKIIGFIQVHRMTDVDWRSGFGSEVTIDTTQDLTIDVTGQFSATDGSTWEILSELISGELVQPG